MVPVSTVFSAVFRSYISPTYSRTLEPQSGVEILFKKKKYVKRFGWIIVGKIDDELG